MRCEKCGEYLETVGDIRRSGGCLDGTVQQIPESTPDSTPIGDMFEAVPGLANRFKPGSLPVEAAAEEAPQPKQKPKQKPPVVEAEPTVEPLTESNDKST